tara:strand:+ start:1782 stop:2480 length:699 start_codon:yes stop_codon:yes gene_type:complete
MPVVSDPNNPNKPIINNCTWKSFPTHEDVYKDLGVDSTGVPRYTHISQFLIEVDFPIGDLSNYTQDIIDEFTNRKHISGDPGPGYNTHYSNVAFNDQILHRFYNVCQKIFTLKPEPQEKAANLPPFIYVQNNAYNHQQWHNHLPSSLASVFYMNIPKDGDGGEFVFFDGIMGQKTFIKPEENKLYIFPGWMLHSPTPQTSEEYRVCVNMEYSGPGNGPQGKVFTKLHDICWG